MTPSYSATPSRTPTLLTKQVWMSMIGRLLLVNSLMILIAFLALKKTSQSYSTQMNLSIPSSISNMSVNVPNISSASVSSSSPYSASRDPRASYQLILQSEEVRQQAADRLNLSIEAFGVPKIKLIDETTVMQMTFNGKTPEETQGKANVLYEVLQDRLDQLRKEEIKRREVGVQSSLGTSRQTLVNAQDQVSNYRVKSGLSSEEQIKDLAKNIEDLRKIRTSLFAESQKSETRLIELTQNLGISPQQASESFTLQSDPLFQQNLKNYSDITANLVILETNFTPQHPKIQLEKSKQQDVRSALLARGSQLLGRSIDQPAIDRLTLSSSATSSSGGSRESLFRDLVMTQVEQHGVTSQVNTLDLQVKSLELRLQSLAQKQSGLDTLKRDLQMAEAVFSSQLTQVDVNRGNIYDSYPLLQKLSGPDTPQPLLFPNPTYIILGTAAGSLFISSAIIAYTFRQSRRPQFMSINS
jgi:uncharacterized protein involved in exopolysaccharide biosynthesis